MTGEPDHGVDVGPLEDFAQRSVRIVGVNGREIGIVRWDGDRVFALANRCPHQGGPLCRGALGPLLESSGDPLQALSVDEARPVLACAWHRWEFDVVTGRSVWDPRYRVRTYPATVVDGRVVVAVRSGRAKAAQGEEQ